VQATIEALLFDLGRVIIDISTDRAHGRWAELAGVPVAEIAARHAARIVGSEAYCRHERGEITDQAFFAHLRRDLEIELTDAQLSDGWNAVFIGEMPDIRRVLARAQTALPLFAFSNTNTAHTAFWSVRFADLLAPFRKIYLSHEIGARKPEPAAFRAVVADMAIAPQRILFFDDVAENVAGARECGLNAVQVATTADIERALGNMGCAFASDARSKPDA
jgi:glucose-1-phosphatase